MTADAPTGPRLSEVIAELGQAKADKLGTELLAEVVRAVNAFPGTTGKVVMTIDAKEEDGAVVLNASFRTKRPHEPIPPTRMWVDDKHQLSLFNPDPDAPQVIHFRAGPRGGGKGPAS